MGYIERGPMRKSLAFILWTLTLSAAPALAQEQATPVDPGLTDQSDQATGSTEDGDGDAGGMTDIALEDWRDMVRGRTVTYSIGGDIWARETYDTGSDTVWIRLADGSCMEGIWTWAAGVYCFDWTSGEFSCFRHVRADDQILVIPVLEDGTGIGTIQTVTQISDVPASCGPELTS